MRIAVALLIHGLVDVHEFDENNFSLFIKKIENLFYTF